MVKNTARKIEVAHEEPSAEKKTTKMKVDDACAWFGEKQALFSVNMEIAEREVTAIIGPSGCGKSTLIRCFNRMHETVPTAKFTGDIVLDGKSIFAPTMDPVVVRRRIGMVFQKPTPFPTLSIYENVVVGLTLNGVRDRKVLDQAVEKSLRKAALWEEVKRQSAKTRSGLVGRSAAAPLHRQSPGGGTRSAFDGRTLLGTGSDLYLEGGRVDP